MIRLRRFIAILWLLATPIPAVRAEGPNRPQTPVPPFPYKIENLQIPNRIDNIELAGTLTIPESASPLPAVVLITGSGPQDRDETVVGHKPFAVIADYLSRNGIAVLRYDDRGVGESTGSFPSATTRHFANDAWSAVSLLRNRADIESKKIGLIGHSEGGVVAPMVAAAHPSEIACIILLAAPAFPGEKILREQSRDVYRLEGWSEDLIERNEVLRQEIHDAIKADADRDTLRKMIREANEEIASRLPAGKQDAYREKSAKWVEVDSSPWYRFFIEHDPCADLRRVKCPVLAITGSLDSQVRADSNLDAISKALKETNHRHSRTRKWEGLNHLFQHAKTGQPAEYAVIEETFAPEVLQAIAQWIQSCTRS
jgi:pimeloyl-ACP methyl ester carboxylesterase